jgi:hypothetical protein
MLVTQHVSGIIMPTIRSTVKNDKPHTVFCTGREVWTWGDEVDSFALDGCDYSRKGKAVPLEALSGREGSSKLRFPDFLTTAQYGGKVVNPTHRPPLTPGNTPGTHFC